MRSYNFSGSRWSRLVLILCEIDTPSTFLPLSVLGQRLTVCTKHRLRMRPTELYSGCKVHTWGREVIAHTHVAFGQALVAHVDDWLGLIRSIASTVNERNEVGNDRSCHVRQSIGVLNDTPIVVFIL